MPPYRAPGRIAAPEPEPERPPDDDRIILWVALSVSLLGLIPRLVEGGAWGAEPTLALLIAVGSATLLLRGRAR